MLVVRHGHVVFRRGYGVTDLRTLHPIEPNTNFRLASFTKQFTATCIMLLVHDGKLHYDDHLTDIFPEFPAYGKAITIRNLLNHTSGLPDYEDLLMAKYPNTPDDKIPQILDAGVLKLLEQQSSGKFPPGSEVGIQQLRIRRAGDDRRKSLRQAVRPVSARPNLRAPEDEQHSRLRERQERSPASRLRPYQREKTAGAKPIRARPRPCWATAASIPRIDDLAKWDRALRDHTLLTAAEMQPALTPVQPTADPAKFPERQVRQLRLRMVSGSVPGPQAHVAQRRDDRISAPQSNAFPTMI